jgi:hypothetical protein
MEPGEVVEIDRETLAGILEHSDNIRADDTGLAGWIRILSFGGKIIAQEETPDRQILIRMFDAVDLAGEFVDRRLADYDRMWDGCGCKIDYFG